MGDVLSIKRKFFSGLDADKASVVSDIGDFYFATDKDKFYYKTSAGWKTGLGYEYVALPKNAWDWQVGDLVINGAWQVNGLDCGAKGVPAGAKAVQLHVKISDDAAGTEFIVTGDKDTRLMSGVDLYTQVANIEYAFHGIVEVDSDLLLDYLGAVGLGAVAIAVIGYFI